jgi:hypothetical protein
MEAYLLLVHIRLDAQKLAVQGLKSLTEILGRMDDCSDA